MSELPADQRDVPVRCAIRIQGRLDERWTAWFGGLTITADTDGTTVISGEVVDQSALHGLLQKLRDVGLPLISITPLDPTAHERG